MPNYEFFCHACKKMFSKILTIACAREGKDHLPALRQPQNRTALGRLLRGHVEEECVKARADAQSGFDDPVSPTAMCSFSVGTAWMGRSFRPQR